MDISGDYAAFQMHVAQLGAGKIHKFSFAHYSAGTKQWNYKSLTSLSFSSNYTIHRAALSPLVGVPSVISTHAKGWTVFTDLQG